MTVISDCVSIFQISWQLTIKILLSYKCCSRILFEERPHRRFMDVVKEDIKRAAVTCSWHPLDTSR